ncbi:MAG: hypothetical protein H7A01_15470 [Hahellaceae bacterium]|nr:hypothetical protein [Hahellaceae bacterium]MCP5210462.1 hypothetical protein [Hahellaceae bacterium]
MKQAHFVSLKRQPTKAVSLLVASLVLTACASAPQKATRVVTDEEDYAKRSAPVMSEPAPSTAADVTASSSEPVPEKLQPKKVVPEPEPVKPVVRAPAKAPDPKPVAKPVAKPAVKADPVVVSANKSTSAEQAVKAPSVSSKQPVTAPDSEAGRVLADTEHAAKTAKPVELAFADTTLNPAASPAKVLPPLRSLDDLPLSLADGWFLQLSALPLAKNKVCVLHNEQDNIFDGYETTSVEAWVTAQKVIVKSKSNFDLSYPGSGLTLHDSEGAALDTFALTATASESVVDSEFPAQRYARKQNLKMVVKTGFWPTWPVTETRTIGFVMNNYHSMLSTLQECATLLQSSQ